MGLLSRVKVKKLANLNKILEESVANLKHTCTAINKYHHNIAHLATIQYGQKAIPILFTNLSRLSLLLYETVPRQNYGHLKFSELRLFGSTLFTRQVLTKTKKVDGKTTLRKNVPFCTQLCAPNDPKNIKFQLMILKTALEF